MAIEFDGCYAMLEEQEVANRYVRKLKETIEKMSLRKDYLKSTPALFSFVGNTYQRLVNVRDKDEMHILDKGRLEQYKQIFASKNNQSEEGLIYNARIAKLFEVIFDREEQHKLLFIPPVYSKRQLSGVFEGKWGISKRLFFTDYTMTPKSLAVVITYEAEKRVVGDLKNRYGEGRKIPYVENDNGAFVEIGALARFDAGDFGTDRMVHKLYLHDKEQYAGGKLSQGSPYAYAYGKFKQNDGTVNEKTIEKFCKAYFKYMLKKSSLRVVLAYYSVVAEPASIYDAIIRYGYDGCIWDVFDEYYEYVDSDINYADVLDELFRNTNPGVQIECKSSQWPNTKRMPTDFASGHYAGAKENSESSAKTFERKIQRFNSPFWPFQFISTSIGQEGFDFHVYCRKVVHWSLEYNPVKFEQREGRVNRYQGYANRLRTLLFLLEKFPEYVFQGWKKTFDWLRDGYSQEIQELKKKSKGLFPDYTIPDVVGNAEMTQAAQLVRECYYYPHSVEAHRFKEVIQTVGYYRTLLGQTGSDTFEDEFVKFVEAVEGKPIEECELHKYFINIYPC